MTRMTPSSPPPRHVRCFVVAAAAAGLACGAARVDTDPASLELHGRGQKATVHAVPMTKNGKPLPDEACKWSSSDEKVATVAARHNEATITAVGHGHAVIRCDAGGATAEVPVTVMLVTRVDVQPRALELRVLDEPLPSGLAVRAYDGDGREVQGRIVLSRCLDENVCRGDARGQVWPVGPGDTRVVIQVDDGEGDAAIHVDDARSAAARPRLVTGNPMEHLGEAAPGEATRGAIGDAPGGATAGGRRERRSSTSMPILREDMGHGRGGGRGR
jgi:hypothetical protein